MEGAYYSIGIWPDRQHALEFCAKAGCQIHCSAKNPIHSLRLKLLRSCRKSMRARKPRRFTRNGAWLSGGQFSQDYRALGRGYDAIDIPGGDPQASLSLTLLGIGRFSGRLHICLFCCAWRGGCMRGTPDAGWRLED